MTTTRSHIVDTLTSRTFIISVIVFVLLAPLPAALGFTVGTREVVVALVAAVIGWEVIRGRHRVLGFFFFFAWLTIGVLGMVGLLFAHTT